MKLKVILFIASVLLISSYNSQALMNQENTINTLNGTHLWIMDECAANYAYEQPQGYSVSFLANNFDIFLVGDWSMGSYRIPNILSHISQIKNVKPEAKFVYYSHFHQLVFDEPLLNLDENNFIHSTDPSSLILVPTSSGILINFKIDDRNRYTNNFIADSYNIYKSTDGNSFSLLINTRENTYIDSNIQQGNIYYYKIKTVKLGSSTDYDYSNVKLISNNPLSFYAYNGVATILNKDLNNQIYDILFTLNTNIQADQVYVYLDLDNDWVFDANEKFAMNYINNRYELTKNINLRSSRSWIQSNVEYGIPYFFEVIKNSQSYYLPADSRTTNNIYISTENNRIKHRIYGSRIFNIKYNRWRNYYLDHINQVNIAQNLDGVYIDEPRYDVRYFTDAKPIEYTQADQDNNVRSLAVELRNRYPNKLVFYNSLDQINLNSEGLDGGLIEGYGTEWNGNYNYNLWIDHQNKVIQSEREGLSFMLPINLNNEQKRMFMLSSYLLVKGDGSYLWHDGWNCPTQSSIKPELVSNLIDLGSPIGNYPSNINDLKTTQNLYLRQYAKGIVIVNPNSYPINYNLNNQYKEILLGNSISLSQSLNSLSIPQNSGKILLLESTNTIPLPNITLPNGTVKPNNTIPIEPPRPPTTPYYIMYGVFALLIIGFILFIVYKLKKKKIRKRRKY